MTDNAEASVDDGWDPSAPRAEIELDYEDLIDTTDNQKWALDWAAHVEEQYAESRHDGVHCHRAGR